MWLVGAPAQVKKEISGESLRVVELGPVLYAENSQIYREQGIGLPGQAEQI